MKLLFFFYFHIKKSIYSRFSALFFTKTSRFSVRDPTGRGKKRRPASVLMGKPDVFFFSLYIHLFYHVETAIWD